MANEGGLRGGASVALERLFGSSVDVALGVLANLNGTTAANTITGLEAPGEGYRWCVCDVAVSNANTTMATAWSINTATKTLCNGYNAAEAPWNKAWRLPLRGGNNEAIRITPVTSQTTTGLYVTVSAFREKID